MAALFAVAIALLLLGETPGPLQLAGIAIIFAGIILLFRTGPLGRRLAVLAMALPLGAALVRGLVQPLVKIGLAGWPNPFAAVTIGFAVSALILLVAARAVPKAAAAQPASNSGRGWFAAVGIANGLAVLLLYAALSRGPVSLVAPLVACYPLFTLALSRWVLGSGTFDTRTAIAVALTVAGVAVILLA